MAGSLGILVSSSDHLDKIIRLLKAANKKEIDVTIFLTHLGTRLTLEPRFQELEGLAKIAICMVALESNGMKPPVPGIGEDDYATQARHADMIHECDRYVVF